MKILDRNRLLAQIKYASFVPKSEIQKLAQNKRPQQKQLWAQHNKDLGTASICFIMRDPTEMSMYLLAIKHTSLFAFYPFVQVDMLRRQVEDVEKSKQDMVREYEQQLKKFQEEVSC